MRLSRLTVLSLLRTHSRILDELKRRGVLRTKNNPVADYAEWVVAKGLRLRLMGNSRSGYDATDRRGARYQIKGRRITAHNPSTQLGSIRNLPRHEFDVLIAVIFNSDYSIRYCVSMPHSAVLRLANYRKHTNSWVMHARPTIIKAKGVRNITARMGDGP